MWFYKKYIVKNYSDQILFARLYRKSGEGNKHLDVIGRFKGKNE